MSYIALVALALALAWKVFCIVKRKQRARYIASLDPVKDARKILWYLHSVEFPFLSQKALELGTIRTLGIPHITNLLFKTKYGLKEPEKRAAETNILVAEMISHHVDSERGSYAVRRLNGIHAKFKIPNHEFVYVLCLNVVHTIDFCSKFGFRRWTQSEQLAAYTVWHDVGVRMGMKDIPHNIQAMRDFIQDFEAQNAVFTEQNKKIVQELKHLVLDSFPNFIQPVVEAGVCSMLDSRIRQAVGLHKPPMLVEWMIMGSLKLVAGTFVSLFMPPRSVQNAQGSIQVDWCPNPAANPDLLRQLNVNVYTPPAFQKGYKLSELGALKHGKLGPRHDGDVLCPFTHLH